MAYLLDANVFIEAKDHHYGLDFCPAFWEWLVARHAAGGVFSIQKVWDELEAREDPLTEWARNLDDGFFLRPDPVMLGALQEVSAWVESQSYGEAAIRTFLGAADYYLIAHALAHSHVVVTHEVVKKKKRKIQIPEVCIAFRVACVSPFHMLRKERALFVLGKRP